MEEKKSLITEDVIVKGDIITMGDIDIAGEVEGDVTANHINVVGRVRGDIKAKSLTALNSRIIGNINVDETVTIGNGAIIIGDIDGKNLHVNGAVKGNIDIKEDIILESTSISMGDIKGRTISVINGAVVDGKVSLCYAAGDTSKFFEDIVNGKTTPVQSPTTEISQTAIPVTSEPVTETTNEAPTESLEPVNTVDDIFQGEGDKLLEKIPEPVVETIIEEDESDEFDFDNSDDE